MPLIIEQHFPLGRFHATRWRQNPFEDRFGEFPPSPYRLLRALTGRWFQYAREMGDNDADKRDALLRKIASELPSFSLPEFTWRGQPLKQYIPYKVEWTAKGAADPAYKKAQTTLVEDHYRLIPSDALLFWHWENLEIEGEQRDLLDELLKRILYFGRAESFSRLRRVEGLPTEAELNCFLDEKSKSGAVPTLAQVPSQELNLSALLALSDSKELKGLAIPHGTAWFYAALPNRPMPKPMIIRRQQYPSDLNFIQFAIGGTVYPPMNQWVKVTERFRGGVIRCLSQQLTGNAKANYKHLTLAQRDSLRLVTGKDGEGNPLRGHQHAYFFLWLDEKYLPTRLIVWRKEPFTQNEIKAMLKASEVPIRWGYDLDDWTIRLVPLPFKAVAPEGLFNTAKTWFSVTPFVPPTERHRFRKNGRERASESPENVLIKLLQKSGKPTCKVINLKGEIEEPTWVKLHETRDRRLFRQQSRTLWARPGFWLRLEFSEPVCGPLLLGDSCHFGLGAFKAEK